MNKSVRHTANRMVCECIHPNGKRKTVTAKSMEQAQEIAGRFWRVVPEAVIARYRYTVKGPVMETVSRRDRA